jgi:hypothetical protein
MSALMRCATMTVRQATVVDAEGHFEVAGLVAGDYRVRAAAYDHAPSEPVDAHVAPGEEPAELSLKLPTGGTVYGRVVEKPGGAPLEQARVSVESSIGTGTSALPLVATVVTDAKGEFSLGGLTPGLRSLTIAAYQHDVQIRSGVAVEEGQSTGPLVVELGATKPGEEPKTDLVGIGVALQASGDVLTVTKVFPGGGAALAGLQLGDSILGVDGIVVAELGMQGAIERIRGPEGSIVRLTVRRAADGAVGNVLARRMKITF